MPAEWLYNLNTSSGNRTYAVSITLFLLYHNTLWSKHKISGYVIILW